MGTQLPTGTGLKVSALLLMFGLALATAGCQESGAGSGPRAEPVDNSQPAPPRRGSY